MLGSPGNVGDSGHRVSEWSCYRFLRAIVLEVAMKNRDELDGKTEQVKGRVKQAWGDVTNDERLRDEGVADEAAGEVQEGFGKARRKVGEAIEEVGENLKK